MFSTRIGKRQTFEEQLKRYNTSGKCQCLPVSGHARSQRNHTHESIDGHTVGTFDTFLDMMMMIFDCLLGVNRARLAHQHTHSHSRRTRSAYLLPRMAFDLGKLEFGVVGIHLANLFARRRAEHFDDLHQLVDARVTREDRLAEQQFGEHTASTPHIWWDERQYI